MDLIANEIKKGKVILYNNEPTLVLSHEFSKTGRAGSVNRTKLKGLKTGAIVGYTFAGNEKAEEVEVINRNIQFLYDDGSTAYFMDPVSFDQYEVEIDNIPSGKDYLMAGISYQGLFYEDKVISIVLPKKIDLLVTEAAPGVKGDTAGNAQKEVVLETGAKVHTPLFIKVGDRILVNTEMGTYVSKA